MEAEEAINLQRKNLFEFEEQNLPGNVPQLLNQVVEKCSKILQFHSNSSYVDNALLMLGKSFYYQKNYLKALRKFQELLAAYPESNLILENDLWIAKTQMKLRDYKNALPLLKQVRERAIDEGEDEIVKEGFVEEIVYLITIEKYSSAISLMKEFLDASDNDEVNAELVYEMGRLYMKTNDVETAITSYEMVFDFSPSFNIELKTKVELANALRETGKDEQALEILEGMRTENKYSESFDKIDLEIGITLFSLERVDEAVETLVKVDTTYTTSINSGIAKFKLGQIFELYYHNFDSAAAYYIKASSSAAPPEYSKLAAEKAQLFRKYQTLKKNIYDSKKQLYYVENPDEFTKDSLAFYADTLKTDEQITQQIQTDQKGIEGDEKGFVGDEKGFVQQPKTPLKTEGKNPPVRPTLSADSLKNIILKNEFDLANLFYTEMNVPDSAYQYYLNIVENHSNSKYYLQSLYSVGTYYNSVGRREEADSTFNYIYENYKSDKIVNAVASFIKKPFINLNYDPANDLYLAAESKLLDKKYNESVIEFYNIFVTHPQSSLAPKALYAGGWILENELKLFDSAAVFYDSIETKYPQSLYASTVRPKLSLYKQTLEQKKKASEDSLKQIEALKLEKLKADSLKKAGITPQEIKTNQRQLNDKSKKELEEETLKKEENDLKKEEMFDEKNAEDEKHDIKK